MYRVKWHGFTGGLLRHDPDLLDVPAGLRGRKTRLLCDCGGPLEQQYDIERMVKDGYGGERLVADGPGIWRYARLLPGTGAAGHAWRRADAAVPLGRDEPSAGDPPVCQGRRQKPHRVLQGPGRQRRRYASARARLEVAGDADRRQWRERVGRLWRARRLAHAGGASLDADSAAHRAYRAADLRRRDEAVRAADRGRLRGFPRFLSADDAYVGGLREPYRLEGEKTVLFELAEQFGWRLPDYIVWPTGGAVGLDRFGEGL